MVAWSWSTYYLGAIAPMGEFTGASHDFPPLPFPADPNLNELGYLLAEPDPVDPTVPGVNWVNHYRYLDAGGGTGMSSGGTGAPVNPHIWILALRLTAGEWTPSFTPESVTPASYSALGTGPEPDGSVTGPANDHFADSTLVSIGTPFTYDTTGSTFQAGEVDRNYNAGAGSVWYKFVATSERTKVSFEVGAGSDATTQATVGVYYRADTSVLPSMDDYLNDADASGVGDVGVFYVTTVPGLTYYLSVQGTVQLGTVTATALYPGPWITPDVGETTVRCGARIWLTFNRIHPPVYQGTDVFGDIYYPEQETYNDEYYGVVEQASSGPDQGGEDEPWYRAEYSSKYNPDVPNTDGEWRDTVGVAVYVWRPSSFPDRGPQLPFPEGADPLVTFERVAKTVQERLVPNQNLTLYGVVVVAGTTQSNSGEMRLTRADANSYLVTDDGQIHEPWYPNGGAGGAHGATPPAPDLFGVLGSKLLASAPENAETVFPATAIGDFDPQGGVAVALAPVNLSRPHGWPPDTKQPDAARGRLQAVAGDTGFSAIPADIAFQYYPDRYRFWFLQPLAPLRQRQRQDGLAISAPRQFARNRPKSKQISVRSGWEGTHL